MTQTSPDSQPTTAERLAAALRLVAATIPWCLILAGAVVLVVGVSMWSRAASVVLAGVLLAAAGILTLEREPRL